MLVAGIGVEGSEASRKVELLITITRIETNDMASFKFGQWEMKLFVVGNGFFLQWSVPLQE